MGHAEPRLGALRDPPPGAPHPSLPAASGHGSDHREGPRQSYGDDAAPLMVAITARTQIQPTTSPSELAAAVVVVVAVVVAVGVVAVVVAVVVTVVVVVNAVVVAAVVVVVAVALVAVVVVVAVVAVVVVVVAWTGLSGRLAHSLC